MVLQRNHRIYTDVFAPLYRCSHLILSFESDESAVAFVRSYWIVVHGRNIHNFVDSFTGFSVALLFQVDILSPVQSLSMLGARNIIEFHGIYIYSC